VRDAFQQATRWCFISMIPWSGIALASVLFLSTSQIEDMASQRAEVELIRNRMLVEPGNTMGDAQVYPPPPRGPVGKGDIRRSSEAGFFS